MSTIQGANQMSQANPVHSLANVAAARATSKEPAHIAGTGIEAKKIHAWFGDKHVIDDVSIDFFPGTVTALIGPSGCGKSTFIRILNRMHEFIPTAAMAGEVLLEGKDIYQAGTDVTRSDWASAWFSKSQIHSLP